MAKFFVIALIVAYIALAAASDDAVNDPDDYAGSKPRRFSGVGGVGGVGGVRTVSGVSTTQQQTSSYQSGGLGGYYGGLGIGAPIGIGGYGINGLGYNRLGYGNLGYGSLGYAAYPGIGRVAYGGIPLGYGLGYGLH